MIYLRLSLLLLSSLFLSGCDDIEVVFAWLTDLIGGYFNEFGCWLFGFVILIFQFAMDVLFNSITPLVDLLPEYAPSPLVLSDIPFMGYAAYFLPISEGATLVGYLLTFYSGYWVIKVILRWLKVVR